MTVPRIALNDGTTIPQLGFGVFQVPPEDTFETVSAALEVGYRHIDTAEMYGNEAGVGKAVRESGIPRDEIYVTSKLNNGNHGREAARRAFAETVETLDIGHVDLFLIHWPLPAREDYVETWQALTELLGDGTLRTAGVSNFQVAHLERLREASDVVPAINQIELHPYLTQQELRDYHAEHGIVTEAWSPLAQGGDLLQDELVSSLAQKYGKTPAQLVLAWHVAIGNVVFPKSTRRERMQENFDVFDVQLDGDDVDAISGLNRDERVGPDPDRFNPA